MNAFISILLWSYSFYFSVDAKFTTYVSNSGTIDSWYYTRGDSQTFNIRLNDKTRWIKLQWSLFNVDGDMPSCIDDNVRVYVG